MRQQTDGGVARVVMFLVGRKKIIYTTKLGDGSHGSLSLCNFLETNRSWTDVKFL